VRRHDMDMVRLELPALRALRLSNVGTRDAAMWVVTGPTSDIAAAVAAGGAWVLTRRGPRAVLVDRVVTVGGTPAIVPQEPEFADDTTTRQVNVTEMSTDMLRALLAEREAQERAQAQDAPAAPVTSAAKRTTRTTRKSAATKSAATKSASASATKRTTRKSASEAQDRARAAAAAAAVADVSDEDLRALLAQAQAQ